MRNPMRMFRSLPRPGRRSGAGPDAGQRARLPRMLRPASPSRRRDDERTAAPATTDRPAIPSLDEARRMSPSSSHRMPLPLGLQGVHHVVVAIPTGGEEVARDFWQTVMGLEEITKPPHLSGHGVWLRGTDVEVHCPPVSPFVPQRDDPPAFLVADVDYAVRQLTANGVHAVIAAKQWPGWVRAVLDDPFGNKIRLVGPEPDTAA